MWGGRGGDCPHKMTFELSHEGWAGVRRVHVREEHKARSSEGSQARETHATKKTTQNPVHVPPWASVSSICEMRGLDWLTASVAQGLRKSFRKGGTWPGSWRKSLKALVRSFKPVPRVYSFLKPLMRADRNICFPSDWHMVLPPPGHAQSPLPLEALLKLKSTTSCFHCKIPLFGHLSPYAFWNS